MQPPSKKQRTGFSVAAAVALVAVTAVAVVATTRAGGPPAWLPPTPCGTSSGKGCAPDSDRVDLRRPRFTHPTDITNPLFPISGLESVVLLGKVDGRPFRSETTLLPRTATVDWDGRRVEVALSQYVAYVDGRIQEVALDRYAQADDGSVWYLGEDVFDYVDGSIAVSEGTWLAGRDGPPAMIMPAHPRPGQVFRAENITGVVFEELRVRDVDVTVDGPSGWVPGAVTMDELHVDGVTVSGKTFAPGYGEFLTLDKPDVEALAIAHGTDRRPGPTPTPIAHLVTAAWGFLEQVRLRDWEAAGDTPGVRAELAVLGWIADRVGGHLRPADQAELDGRVRELRLSPDPADTAARLAAWLRSTPQPAGRFRR